MLALGDDVEAKTTAYYIAFRRIKNFASVELRNQARKLLVFVKVDPTSIQLEKGLLGMSSRSAISARATWKSRLPTADFEKAKALIEAAYNAS